MKRPEPAMSLRDRITGGIRLARPMKIAVDCGNGVAGATEVPVI